MLRYVMRINITLHYCWRSEGVTKCDTGIPARPQKTPAPQKSKISDDKEDKIMWNFDFLFFSNRETLQLYHNRWRNPSIKPPSSQTLWCVNGPNNENIILLEYFVLYSTIIWKTVLFILYISNIQPCRSIIWWRHHL